MRITFAILAATVAVVSTSALWSGPVRADDNGVAASIHDVKREGRKLCQVGHFHSGSSAGISTKKGAMAEAIDSWQSFTAFEYGTDWASFRNAASKSVSCSQSSGGWGCDIEARPCKRL